MIWLKMFNKLTWFNGLTLWIKDAYLKILFNEEGFYWQFCYNDWGRASSSPFLWGRHQLLVINSKEHVMAVLFGLCWISEVWRQTRPVVYSSTSVKLKFNQVTDLVTAWLRVYFARTWNFGCQNVNLYTLWHITRT